MAPLRRIAVVVLVLFPATGSAQQSARSAVPMPVTAAAFAAAVNSPNHNRSDLLLDAIRILFDAPDAPGGVNGRLHAQLMEALRGASSGSRDLVPLPLAPSVWREAILETPVPDDQLITAILAGREAALLYYAFSALDDETLGWLAKERTVLAHLRKHAGAFASFGRSLRIRGGRVAVPGGEASAPLWQDVVGADPANPSAFVRALFKTDRGRTAFLYDTVAHLDPARQRAVLTRRLTALAQVFHDFARDWDAETRPFARPQLDPSLLLFTMRVDENGALAGPRHRGVWERVFRDELSFDVAFREVLPWKTSSSEDVDAAWVANQIHKVIPRPGGRRRLDTFLLGQRLFAEGGPEPHVTATVLRAYVSMPSLMLTLERMGVRNAPTLLAAVRHAQSINGIGDSTLRETALSLFQATLGLMDRGARNGGLPAAAAAALIESLAAVPIDRGRGYDERLAAWLRTELFKAAPQPPLSSTDPVEEALLAMVAGGFGTSGPLVEWEGHTYRLDAAAAEIQRLHRVRERQAGPSVDAAIGRLLGREQLTGSARERARRDFREALVSVLYAAHLGDPEGPAVAAGNVALKHDFGLTATRPGVDPMTAWRVPAELFGGSLGWRVQGSLLVLDAALRSLALRRLDSSEPPTGPRMPVLERQTAMMTVALANPRAMTDDTRDRVAAALARGRAGLQALRDRPALADDVAEKAGLSEWQREALRWSLTHAPEETTGSLSLVQLFWLGGGAEDADAWGAAAFPMTGCLCIEMPRPFAWENLAGRPASGLLASRGADVTLRVAEALAERRLPAALMPAVLAFAMQDVLDSALPAYFDDWPAFCRAAKAIAPDRIDDYIAALTATGPLVPASRGTF